jgi:hypothetical protein
MWKDKMYFNNPHLLQELNDNTELEMFLCQNNSFVMSIEIFLQDLKPAYKMPDLQEYAIKRR